MPFRAFINRVCVTNFNHIANFGPLLGYIAKQGEPVLPPGMRELLHKDLDRGFDF